MTETSAASCASDASITPEAATPPPVPAQLPPAGLKLRIALLVSLIYYAVTLGISVPIAVYMTVKKLPIDNTLLVLVSQLTGWPAALITGVWLGKSSWKQSYALRTCSARLLPGLMLGCFGLTFVLNRLASTIPVPEHISNMFKSLINHDQLLVSLLVLVILAPLFEELFFRGWMLRGFLRRYSPTRSIWLTAILFALFHLNPWQAIVALPLGLLFGWLAWRTGSLIPGMLGHFIVNLTGSHLLLPISGLLGYSKKHLEDAAHLPGELVGLGAVLAITGLLWMTRNVNRDALLSGVPAPTA